MACQNEYMKKALSEAGKAFDMGEVPIGAVIVTGGGSIVAKAHNLREKVNDPLGHAEVIAIRNAAMALGRWRLSGCVIYVTVEPCPMCAGAIQQARIDKLVYGCDDPKAGSAGSLYNIPQDKRFAHQVEVVGGICEEECRSLITKFFESQR